MRLPLIRNLPAKTNFRYVRFAGFAAILSILAVIGSLASIIAPWVAGHGPGFNLGIDFRGGTLIEMRAPEEIDLGKVRATLSAMQLGDVQVQAFGAPENAVVQFESPADRNPAEVVGRVQERLRAGLGSVEFTRVEAVGPKVSDELMRSGLFALGAAILLMLVYIWFRFELKFGLGSVLALFHDVILTLGLFSVLRLEFTLTIIAALLTIIGYSMNDTVVVFDRLRENLRKYKRMSVREIIDLSINETLSRTIITGLTALLALVGMAIVAGEALRGFAIAMIFGIVVGTYSSIYVAAPALLLTKDKRGQEGEAEPAKTSG